MKRVKCSRGCMDQTVLTGRELETVGSEEEAKWESINLDVVALLVPSPP